MHPIIYFIQNTFGISPNIQIKIFYTIIAVLIWKALEKLLKRIIFDRIEDVTLRYQWQKIVKYFIVFLIILILIKVWFGEFGSIGTYFGLVSAGLAIALRDLLENLAGWIFILIRKPFDVGDRIEISDTIGDVIDIRIFQFSVIEIGNWVDADQSTGRIIHIPNGTVFKKLQANYTSGFEYIWDEIPVIVTFESDWKKAKEILLDIVTKNSLQLSKEAERQIKDTAKKFLIFYNKLTPIVYTSVKNNGILLTIRYLSHVRRRRGTAEAIWEEILTEFAKYNNISFAYPTQRFFNNLTEGKEGTKPK